MSERMLLTWCPCGCICAKACSGRDSTEKGLDMIARFPGGVPGELLRFWLLDVNVVSVIKHETVQRKD